MLLYVVDLKEMLRAKIQQLGSDVKPTAILRLQPMNITPVQTAM